MIFPIIPLVIFSFAFIGFLFISPIIHILYRNTDNLILKTISKEKNVIIQNLFINFLLCLIAYTLFFFNINLYVRYLFIIIIYILVIMNFISLKKIFYIV